MPNYAYTAVSDTGAVLKGTFSASAKSEVIEMLQQRGSYPVRIEEKKDLNITFRRRRGVGARDIAVLCRQFYAMLNAGVSIVSSLEILRVQTDHPTLRDVISSVYMDVQKGMALSEAMKKHSGVLPALLINMVESGELSGTVDAIMFRMSQYYEKEAKLINKIRTAMVYPIILSGAAVAVVVFLLTFVMPTFVEMFTDAGVPLPIPTRILIASSRFLRGYWWAIVLAVVALFLLGRRYARSTEGRWRIDRLKFRLPLVKRLTPRIASARFARTLATLLSSGVPMLAALENVGLVSDNRVIEDVLEKTRVDMRRGQPLSAPIERSGVFPPTVHHMIRVGEESGTLDQLLDKTADYYDEEVETVVQQLAAMFEPAMIITMAVLVGFIVISMIMPVFDMGRTVM